MPAALELMALGGEAALELGDDPVHGGEILDRPGRQRAIELGQRALGRQARRALDQAALQLSSEVGLEAAQLLAGDAVAAGIVGRQVGLGLGAQAQRPADPLDVDAEHPRALAPAEGGDGQPGEIAELGVGALLQGGGDLLAERVEVELEVGAGALAGGALGDVLAARLGLGGAEEEALEHQLEDAAVLRGLGEGRRHRLLEVRLAGPADVLKRREGVEQLGGAERHALLAQLLGEAEQLAVEPARAAFGDLRVDLAG